ncbi:NAD(P)/FAD-dependent oxidoreductase [Streptomyces sp. NBC_01304]|uniref:NAD(P)/FAD-dependent oxidoreductase n=1 Tax=Streptomyces sp. NBC_01304 TaxID=2903818 RepID=UPI002E111D44|nr:FAD-binding oxidoreductase [Streptomyces sp. NBC_01304]
MSAVVVVGAGIVGSSVAYHLACRGVPVTLLDQGPSPATGVTGDSFAWIGNAGRQWPGGARDLRASVLADHRRLETELPEIAVRWTGSLTWTDALLQGGQNGQHAQPGPGQYVVGPSDIAALEPHLQDPPRLAIHTPSDGGVDPRALAAALVNAARTHGAEVIYGAAVRSLKMAGSRAVGVLSSAGFHPAETVVLAAGTNVTTLAEPLQLDLPVAASPACLAHLTAPPGLVRTITAGPGFEVREVRDGHLLLVFPHAEGDPAARLEQAARHALRRLQTVFSGGDACRLVDYRIGRRPMPAHGPIVGYATQDRSVYVAVMHSAITLAPTVGRLVADELVSGKPTAELRRCRPRGVPQ